METSDLVGSLLPCHLPARAGTALLGKEAAMACTVAVEEVIGDHYNRCVTSTKISYVIFSCGGGGGGGGGGGVARRQGMVVQAGPFLGRSGGRRMADKNAQCD